MKAKREMTNRRGGDRPGGRDARGKSGTAEAASQRRTRTRSPKSSTPTREARTSNSGPQTSTFARPVERPARAKSTSQAKARAKARKAKAPKVVRPRLTERLAIRLASIDLRPRTLLSKVPFVVLVIGALAVGLGLTLWLSTDSAERSYRLSDARERTKVLREQKESLERDVREAQSAPALAESARKEGMIPTRDTAHLVQDPAGNWVVVGTPKPADGVPPPPLNGPIPEPGPPPPPPAAGGSVGGPSPGGAGHRRPACAGPVRARGAAAGSRRLLDGGRSAPAAGRSAPTRDARVGAVAGAARSGGHAARLENSGGARRGARSAGRTARPSGPGPRAPRPPCPGRRVGACSVAAAGRDGAGARRR